MGIDEATSWLRKPARFNGGGYIVHGYVTAVLIMHKDGELKIRIGGSVSNTPGEVDSWFAMDEVKID